MANIHCVKGVINESNSKVSTSIEEYDETTNGVAGILTGGNPRYKTEMCRNFKEKSKCIYGDQCQFAHGKGDLREVIRNTKYKTKLCQKYWISGYCAYGPRCNFLHDENAAKSLAAAQQLAILTTVNSGLKQKSSTGCSPTPSSSSSEIEIRCNTVLKENTSGCNEGLSGLTNMLMGSNEVFDVIDSWNNSTEHGNQHPNYRY